MENHSSGTPDSGSIVLEKKKRILIIEDNADSKRFLEAMLNRDYEVITAENGVTGMEQARNKRPELIIMDILIPVLNGIDACSLLKKDERTRRIPIILLSVKNTQADIKAGLAVGADDYITKPFDFQELKARIQTRLEKTQEMGLGTPLQVGDLLLEPNLREASFAGKKVKLTLTEFDILRALATQAGEVVSRDEILSSVWRDESGQTNDRTIDVHIRALRKKIPSLTKHIISIYGVGYKYEK